MNPNSKEYTHTEMVDGHPITYNKLWRNDPVTVDDELIENETVEIQEKVFAWIKENIYPRKTPLEIPNSYGLKHILKRDTDIYLTNNAFKDAMLQCGFEPVDYEKLNWSFRISKRSPALKRR